eukprot:gene55351-63801_t
MPQPGVQQGVFETEAPPTNVTKVKRTREIPWATKVKPGGQTEATPEAQTEAKPQAQVEARPGAQADAKLADQTEAKRVRDIPWARKVMRQGQTKTKQDTQTDVKSEAQIEEA